MCKSRWLSWAPQSLKLSNTELNKTSLEIGGRVNTEMAVLGSPSLTVLNMVSVNVSSERTLLLAVVIYLQFKKKEMYSMVL